MAWHPHGIRVAAGRGPLPRRQPARPDQGAGGPRPGQAKANRDVSPDPRPSREAIAGLHEVAGNLAELSALLGGDEAGEGKT